MTTYFIIRPQRDDGGASVDGPFGEEELLRRITPDRNGDSYYGTNPRFCTELPNFDVVADDDNPIVIVRGSIIVPKAVTVVTKLELP